MGMKMIKWMRIFIFFALNQIMLLLGAVIFMYIEYKHTAFTERRNLTELRDAIEDIMGVPLNRSTFERVFANIDNYVHSDKECKTRTYEAGWKKVLDGRTFLRWCYFTYTVVTTIGYGDVVVESDFGKIFLSFYALLGIPLHLYTSFLVGKAITHMLKHLLRFVEFTILQRVAIKQEASKVLFMSFLLIIVWMLICSVIIVKQTDWSAVDAWYFSLVSMSTIGFGDFTLDFESKYYLHWHLYIGTSLLASIINGIVDFLKNPHDASEYNMSRNKRRVSIIDAHKASIRHAFELNGSYILNNYVSETQIPSKDQPLEVINNSLTTRL